MWKGQKQNKTPSEDNEKWAELGGKNKRKEEWKQWIGVNLVDELREGSEHENKTIAGFLSFSEVGKS